MPIRPTSESDRELCLRCGRIFVWIQAAVTLFLLMNTLAVPVHLVLLSLLVLTLLLDHKLWERRTARVVARIAVGAIMPLLLLSVADLVLSLTQGMTVSDAGTWVYFCIGSLWPLAALMPAAFAMAAHRGRYDRVILCLYQSWMLLSALPAIFLSADQIVWTWDHPTVRYVWLGIIAACTILAWLCSLQRTADDKPAPKKKNQAAKGRRSA